MFNTVSKQLVAHHSSQRDNFSIKKTYKREDNEPRKINIFRGFFIMDFSLLSPLEFFVDPKNGDGRNNKPPAMRVRVDCYTKKLPFRLQ